MKKNTNKEVIYEYSKLLNNGENFYKNISLKMSISKKKLIEHKCIIFFTYFDIKRLPSSANYNCWNFYVYFWIYAV